MNKPLESVWSLRLPADLSIRAIRDAYALIRDAFGRKDKLEIDCSSVDKADVTSVQLLLSTTKTAHLQGRGVTLTPLSPALHSTFERAGVSTDALTNHKNPQQNGGV